MSGIRKLSALEVPMDHGRIEWDRSIEQQIEQIVLATATARRLLQQIKCKENAYPGLITKENYAYFQWVIHSMDQLASEVEANPLYTNALAELRNKQRKKQRRVVAKYFGDNRLS
jgi:hypothetical protein